MSVQKTKFLAFRVYRFKDKKAFDELYDLYVDRIHRFFVHKLPRGEDAEELTNEVFLRGWEYMTSSSVDYASAFFFRIARNLVADFYRTYRPGQDLGAHEEELSTFTLEDEVATHLEVERITQVLRLLKAEYGEVLVMRFFNQMTIEEIAAALEKTPNNVRVLLHRAKKALEEELKQKK